MLRTTGGDCETAVAAAYGSLLQRAGLEGNVYLDRGEFEGGRRAFLRAYGASVIRKAYDKQNRELPPDVRRSLAPPANGALNPVAAPPGYDPSAPGAEAPAFGGADALPATVPGPDGRPIDPRTLSSDPKEAAALAAAHEAGARVAAARRAAAAAGVESRLVTKAEFDAIAARQAEQQSKDLEEDRAVEAFRRQIATLDPLLSLVAAVPWVDRADERRAFAKTAVLDKLEGDGWNVRGAAQRVWNGERSFEALAKGKDAGSAAAIQALLFHAIRNDAQYGSRAGKREDEA